MPSTASPACQRNAAKSLLMGLCLSALATGCYDPNLGDTPFVCAATGKECPDGYRCDKQKNLCVRDTGQPVDAAREIGLTDGKLPPSKEGPVFLDGSVVQSSEGCVDSTAEPNNTAETAFKLFNTGRITDWEICYAGDIDHYSIELDTGQKLEVLVLFNHEDGDLEAALLNPEGNVILASRGAENNETLDLPTATIPGAYVVAVYGFGAATNVYDLDINIE